MQYLGIIRRIPYGSTVYEIRQEIPVHTDYTSTWAKLASFGLQNDEGVTHETNWPTHPEGQWRLVER